MKDCPSIERIIIFIIIQVPSIITFISFSRYQKQLDRRLAKLQGGQAKLQKVTNWWSSGFWDGTGQRKGPGIFKSNLFLPLANFHPQVNYFRHKLPENRGFFGDADTENSWGKT